MGLALNDKPNHDVTLYHHWTFEVQFFPNFVNYKFLATLPAFLDLVWSDGGTSPTP
jgi:hypothetical protein